MTDNIDISEFANGHLFTKDGDIHVMDDCEACIMLEVNGVEFGITPQQANDLAGCLMIALKEWHSRGVINIVVGL